MASLYRFQPLPDPEGLKAPLAAFCCARRIKGTLLLATEGINGTVAGTDTAIADLVREIEMALGVPNLEIKYGRAADMPFHRMKVRVKKEIVTMGVAGIDPLAAAGTYVEAKDWNRLIADPDTVVVDTRNAYEVALGTFRNAVDPGTATFGAFPAWADARRETFSGRKVAMFCTGGIRCEKATAYMKAIGVANVFHLRGGILKYLEEVPAEDSLWSGECFVFDGRVSVGHGLAEGEAVLCRACRHPLTKADTAAETYVDGISCPHCHEARSAADRERYAERHRQVLLADARGARHVGS